MQDGDCLVSLRIGLGNFRIQNRHLVYRTTPVRRKIGGTLTSSGSVSSCEKSRTGAHLLGSVLKQCAPSGAIQVCAALSRPMLRAQLARQRLMHLRFGQCALAVTSQQLGGVIFKSLELT